MAKKTKRQRSRTRGTSTRRAAASRKSAPARKRTVAKRRPAKKNRAPAVESSGAANIHSAVLRNLQQWVSELDEAELHRPLVGTAGGDLITPAGLVKHVEMQTKIGREYVQSLNRLAINHVMHKMRSSS